MTYTLRTKLISCMILGHMALANSSAQESPSGRYLKELTSQNTGLSKALEITEVRSIYDKCYEVQHTNNNGQISSNELMNCLWSGDTINSIPGVKSKPELAKRVTETISQTKDGKERSIANVKYQKQVSVIKDKDPAIVALEQYYSKRLEEALYGGENADKNSFIKTNRMADQEVFYKLYKSQLGKNIIAAMTSYCIEAQNIPMSRLSIPLISHEKSKRNKQKDKNLKSLKETRPTEQGTQQIVATQKWSECIQNIQHVCHQPQQVGYKPNENAQQQVISLTQNDMKRYCKEAKGRDRETDCEETIAYSQQRACVVTQYMSEARRNMGIVDKTIELYSKLETQPSNADGVKFYKNEKTEKSIDDLTSITSNEVFESDYAQTKNQELEKFKECYDQGKVIDQEACNEYFNQDKEKSFEALAEFKLKQEASLQRIKDIDPNDTESIKNILIQDGYGQEEAEELSKLDQIKQQIEDRYEKKKDALVADLASRIDDMSTQADKFDPSSTQDLDKLKRIEEELKADTKEFASLVHFNNIVSSYLQITDGEEKSFNTASLKRELDGNAFSKENKKENKVEDNFSVGIDDYNSYQQRELASTGVEIDRDDSSSNKTTDLTIEQINKSLINFFRPASKK